LIRLWEGETMPAAYSADIRGRVIAREERILATRGGRTV
jgi:hypothetical protein